MGWASLYIAKLTAGKRFLFDLAAIRWSARSILASCVLSSLSALKTRSK